MNILQQIGTDVKNHVQDHKGVIKIIDSETNILARDSDDVGTVALGTDTDDIYIHTGSGVWVRLVTQAT